MTSEILLLYLYFAFSIVLILCLLRNTLKKSKKDFSNNTKKINDFDIETYEKNKKMYCACLSASFQKKKEKRKNI